MSMTLRWRDPEPPEDVRVITEDGVEHHVQCCFQRWESGDESTDGHPVAVWRVVDLPYCVPARVSCAVLPAYCTIEVVHP